MQAYEFNSVIEDMGVIRIPEQYLQKFSSPVKVIIFVNDEAKNTKNKHFSAIKLKTKGFKFDRDIANE